MEAPKSKSSVTRMLLALASLSILTLAACAPQTAAPTAAPAKPAATAAPAKPAPTAAPAKPAATAAPAKPAATAAPAKPAATAAPAKPAATAAPAAKPTEKPAAKAPEFDEKAVADFYKGKTLRMVVGFGAGGAADTNARMLQKVLAKYIPGAPTIVVENKPGGGGLLATNTVYNSEPRDGTVILAIDAPTILAQAIGAPGVQFDSTKINWLASSSESFGTCSARTDLGINSVQDILGASGKEVTAASFGKGTASYDPPSVFNAALGTRFKIVPGYESGAAQRLAVKNKEVQALCSSFEDVRGLGRDVYEGDNPVAKVLIVTGATVFNHPSLKAAVAAETLAKTDEARAMLKAIHAPFVIRLPTAFGPDVPKDRVQALRRAFDKGYADREFLDGAEKAQLVMSPKTGETVTRIAGEILGTPAATLAKLKQVLE